jgi:hypothetical protein
VTSEDASTVPPDIAKIIVLLVSYADGYGGKLKWNEQAKLKADMMNVPYRGFGSGFRSRPSGSVVSTNGPASLRGRAIHAQGTVRGTGGRRFCREHGTTCLPLMGPPGWREEAEQRRWFGEIEGLDVSIAAAEAKLARMQSVVALGIPTLQADADYGDEA